MAKVENGWKEQAKNYVKSIPESLKYAASDFINNSDFISRSIGMSNSYDDIMFLVQALGREPISLLGKDYLFIFDHVRRNYRMGSYVTDYYSNDCPKFTFYKERPTVRFANPYEDTRNLLDRWKPDMTFGHTSENTRGHGMLLSYAESDDGETDNITIGEMNNVDEGGNPGVRFGTIASFANSLDTCDLLKKTNDNFNHGRYKTLVARFHTKSMDSRDGDDITQTAYSNQYGQSHGRNLLSTKRDTSTNGYENPYCRVWTYHHQYNQLSRAIRPFSQYNSKRELEEAEFASHNYDTVGFRTKEDKEYGFKGGSERLDKFGVLNYRNGLVNIAPTAKIKDYFEHKEDDEKSVSTKKCMFSIENLAWRSENVAHDEYDPFGLSPEQKGPLGGRIMWFPPYDLSFNEDISVNWNANQFIGRGEKVYTYTDTERRGNLSFTLLIDHPAILDYWTGHARNGMENDGKVLIQGNNGGVDEPNNQENTLLRFFAGCDILTAKPQEFAHRDRKAKKEEDAKQEQAVVEDPQETEVHDPSQGKTIHCILYYPNNYSGVDDAPNTNSVVNAIYYLMNGVGAQKYVDSQKNAVDLPTTIDTKVSVAGGVSTSGYEIGGSNGISIADENLNPNYDQIKTTYADLETNERKAQYLTSPSGGNGYTANYGGTTYTLAKLVGSKAMSLNNAKTQSNLSAPKHLWYRKRWYYRVDKEYENQDLSKVDSYLDTSDFGLNGKNGYEKVKSDETIAKAFGLDSSDSATTLISFADMFVALEGSKAENILSGHYDKGNVEIVRNLIDDKNKDRFTITEIKFEGHASYQGYASSNDTLSRNRALTFKKWMNEKGFPNISDALIETKKESQTNNVDKGDNSSQTVKLWRSASVIIKYEESSVETAAFAESSSVESGKTDEKTNAPLNQLDKVSISNKSTSNAPSESIVFPTSENWLDTNQQQIYKNGMNSITLDMEKTRYRIKGEREGKDYFNDQSYNFDNEYLQNQTGVTSVTHGTVERYDNEGEFFELLEKHDPMMHHLITDKIRYFDPAFHSISPEGFNARLTFLHQCTRQGSTVGSSDNAPGTAYNLAFGRPPICVLRLGDFYNTKIVINSISIQYDTPTWDLNPEGIGVMPMFAKVSMNFVFLGGSDLAGPISRLQNAVSFNYYANTSVYDNRAEMVQYDSDGSGHETMFKPFVYNTKIPNKKELEGVVKPQTMTETVENSNNTYIHPNNTK